MANDDKWLTIPLRLPQWSREVDRLFEEIIHRPWGFAQEAHEWNPSIDLYETMEGFVLEADLPGVRREDVKVDVEKNDLILQGERFSERSRQIGRFHYHERNAGKFLRRLSLPESVDKKRIHAEFKEGVLRILLPKSKQETDS